MEYPLSEIVDRLSILMLKVERLPSNEHSPALNNEVHRFEDAVRLFGYSVDPNRIARWIADQKEINGRIWDLEAAIRQGKGGELGLEEVGRRALAMRELNKERIRRKNLIAAEMREFQEIKIDHASA